MIPPTALQSRETSDYPCWGCSLGNTVVWATQNAKQRSFSHTRRLTGRWERDTNNDSSHSSNTGFAMWLAEVKDQRRGILFLGIKLWQDFLLVCTGTNVQMMIFINAVLFYIWALVRQWSRFVQRWLYPKHALMMFSVNFFYCQTQINVIYLFVYLTGTTHSFLALHNLANKFIYICTPGAGDRDNILLRN